MIDEPPVRGPVAGRAVAPDGTGIAYDVVAAGPDGPGEPLVLLAGQANSRDWWRTVRPSLHGYRTVAFDHPGTGASDAPGDGGWSTRRFARDVVAVLDAAGIGRAHVYGTSMGGRIAQWLAAEHAERSGRWCWAAPPAAGPARSPPIRRSCAGWWRPAPPARSCAG